MEVIKRLQHFSFLFLLLFLGIPYFISTYLLYDDSTPDNLVEIAVILRESLFYLTVLQAAYLVFKSNINYIHTMIILLVALAISATGLVSTHIFNFLVDLNILSASSNPQFLNIYLYLIVIIPYFFVFLLSSQKTFDRFFVLLLALVVMVTVFIFHRVTIVGSLKQYEDALKGKITHAISQYDFADGCEILKNDCYLIKDQHYEYVAGNKQVIELFRQKPLGHNFEVGRFAHPSLNQSFRYLFFKQRIYGEERFVISYLDLEHWRNLQVKNFSFLCMCAHLFWILFTYSLIYYHNNLDKLHIILPLKRRINYE